MGRPENQILITLQCKLSLTNIGKLLKFFAFDQEGLYSKESLQGPTINIACILGLGKKETSKVFFCFVLFCFLSRKEG
jgi:hypothetical protein